MLKVLIIYVSKAFAFCIMIMYVNIRQNAWSIVGTQEILESIMSIAVNFDH